MSTSTFFDNINNVNEQSLYEDLIIESIQIYGIDMIYLPRTLNNLDQIYLQDDISTYNQAIEIPLYVKTYQGFEGEGSLFTKFGLEIRDQITFTIAKRVFDNEIGTPYSLSRPKESDLIYYPLNKKLFQVKYVENKPIHYPFGFLPTYDVFCELFEYSNEKFNTGIADLDRLEKTYSTDIYDFVLKDENGKAIKDEKGNVLLGPGYEPAVTDPLENNDEFVANGEPLVDFSETDPWSENWEDNL